MTALARSLVLSQPVDEQVSHKMLKKINYESGHNQNRRILRTLSKSFRNKQQEKKQEQIKQQQPRRVSLIVSTNEIKSPSTPNITENLKSSTVLKSSSNLKSTTVIKAVNLATLRAADRSTSPAKTPLRKNSVAIVPLVRSIELQKAAEFKSDTNLLKSSLRYNLAKSTVDLNKPELVASAGVSKLPSPKLQRKASSTDLKSSGFMKPTTSSSLKSSTTLKSSSTLKQAASPSTRSPLARSSGSPMRSRIPVGAKDTLNVLLSDFQAQKQRSLNLTEMELNIFKQEVAKFEQMEQKKQQRVETANILAKDIKDREARLMNLFVQLDQQQKLCGATEEELSGVSKQFEAELSNAEAAITGVTSAVARMQQAAARKVLKEQWKNSEDPRFRLLQAQSDMHETQAQISVLKKELGRLKNEAGKAKSSEGRLSDEKRMREAGQVRPKGQYVRPKGEPKSNEKKAFVSRLEEEKLRRAATKTATVQHSPSIVRKYAPKRYTSPKKL